MEDITGLIGAELASYWPDMKIYRENQANGFDVPCFYLHRIDLTSNRQYFGYQNRKYSYQLVYFPPEDHPNESMDDMAEQLAANFTVIREFAHIDHPDIKVDQDDQTLRMTFDVSIRAKPDDDTTKLKNIDYSGGTKI